MLGFDWWKPAKRAPSARAPSARRRARVGRLALILLLLPLVLGVAPPMLTAQTPAAQATDSVLSLGDALGMLRTRSPDYRAALAAADATGEGVWQAWGTFLPQVTASASFFRNDFTNRTFLDPTGVSRELTDPVESTSKSAAQSLRFDWTALDGGRRFFELDASRARARSADLGAAATLNALEVRAETQYFEALQQQELARLARQLVDARRRDLEIARARFRIAAVAQTDVLQAEIEVGRQEVAALRAAQAAEAARRELSALIGLDESLDYELADTSIVFEPEVLDPADLLARARSGHPELARLDAEVEAGRKTLWAARGTWLPTISLGLSLGRSEQLGPQGDLFTFDPRNTSTAFSLSVSWPLLNGLQKKWQTGEASARLSQSRHERRGRELALARDVRNAHDRLVAAYRTLELQRRNTELAREAVRLTTERYRIGAASYVELQQAITQATSSEQGLIEARYEFMKSFAALRGAVGGPVEVGR